MSFILTQHTRDEPLMKSFVKYLGCGNYNKKSNKKVGEFQCYKFSDIYEKIIPFFKKYQIRGVKAPGLARLMHYSRIN